MKREFKKGGSVLRHFMNDYMVEQAENYSTFFRGWKNIAGTDLASHSRVKDLYKNTVIVETDHPGWMQLLVMEKNNLLKKLKKNYPELKIIDLRFILTDQDIHEEISSEPGFRESEPVHPRVQGNPEDPADTANLESDGKDDDENEKKRHFEETLKKLGKSIAERQKKNKDLK